MSCFESALKCLRESLTLKGSNVAEITINECTGIFEPLVKVPKFIKFPTLKSVVIIFADSRRMGFNSHHCCSRKATASAGMRQDWDVFQPLLVITII